MKQQDYQLSITVNANAEQTFKCINSVTKWWTENLKGSSGKLNDEFEVQFWDVHYSKQKLIEFIPDKKVVWLVTDSKLSFIENKKEWTNTKISFEISSSGKKTKIIFTHIGLLPSIECYDACSDAWRSYIEGSLAELINTGKGTPEKKE